MLHDPSGTSGSDDKTKNSTDSATKPAESGQQLYNNAPSSVEANFTLTVDGSTISFSAKAADGKVSFSLSADIDISKIADFASKLQSAWEQFKELNPVHAGILGGLGNFAVDTVVGLAHLATHLPETAIGLAQLGFNLSPAGMLLNPDGAKQIFNGIGNAASEGYDKFSNGDTYTKVSMLTYGAAFVGSFFFGAGEAKVASSAGKVGETMNALNKVDDLVEVGNLTSKEIVYEGVTVIQDTKLIDPNLIDDLGRTNLDRMKEGLAPIGSDGKSLNLHHVDQTMTGPIQEMTSTFHSQNYKLLHQNTGQLPSQINRAEFNKWRGGYWQNRFLDF